MVQQELLKEGITPTAENVQKVLEKLASQKRPSDPYSSTMAGEDAIRYLMGVSYSWTHPQEEKQKKVAPTSVATPTSIRPSITREAVSANLRSKRPRYTMELMPKENEREEELRKKWPDNLPWPSLDDCKNQPPAQYMVFTSTWLSVTAKKIK